MHSQSVSSAAKLLSKPPSPQQGLARGQCEATVSEGLLGAGQAGDCSLKLGPALPSMPQWLGPAQLPPAVLDLSKS